MKRISFAGISAFALMAVPVAVTAQPQTQSTMEAADSASWVRGPENGLLALAPTVAAMEPAPVEEAAGEQGRLFVGPRMEDGSEGPVRLVRISAPGAAAYRLYFERVTLPEGARMVLYGLDESGRVTKAFGPYEHSGPLAEGGFRSRVIPGVEAVIEVQGMEGSRWPFELPWVASINAGLLGEMRAAGDPALEEAPEQRRPARGEKVDVEWKGAIVQGERIGGQVLVEGDVAVDLAEDGGKTNRKSSVMRTEASGRWPGGVIPFEGSMANDTRVTAAIQHWNQVMGGVIVFVPRSNEADFIRFSPTSDSVCSSGIGRTSGARVVSVAVPCSLGNLRHELGHALGLQHEQSREDRDNFVKILWDNIIEKRKNNFEKRGGSANTDIGPYDFGSIMHYPLDAFTVNGLDTIQPLIPIPAGTVVGQRNAPSAGDINALKGQYGISVFKTVVNVPAAGGAFAVGVTTQSDRFWVAVDDAPWVSMTNAQGTGSGQIQFTVAPNQISSTTSLSRTTGELFPATRTANIRVSLAPALLVNATIQVVQAAPDCTYSVTPAKITAGADPGIYTVQVTTAPHCTWGAAEALTWATVSPSSGQGSKTVNVTLTGNYNPNSLNKPGVSAAKRTGTITVAGKTVTVEQAGGCLLCD